MKNKIETDNSPEYPFGNMIEPYDEEQERRLVEQAEIARKIHRENMSFIQAQFGLGK